MPASNPGARRCGMLQPKYNECGLSYKQTPNKLSGCSKQLARDTSASYLTGTSGFVWCLVVMASNPVQAVSNRRRKQATPNGSKKKIGCHLYLC